MSFLFLIRHGQASANSTDYDQLSALGYHQSKLLGTFLASRNIQRVFIGPRKRHRQTHDQAMQSSWPEPQITTQLDEFPAHDLMYKALNQLTTQEPSMKQYAEEIHKHVGTDNNAFGILLRRITDLWVAEKITHADFESFADYKNRLEQFLDQIRHCDSSGDILAFTSAGTLSSIVGLLLQADPTLAIRMTWSVFNGSVTTIRKQGTDLSLASFNAISHIPKSSRSLL